MNDQPQGLADASQSSKPMGIGSGSRVVRNEGCGRYVVFRLAGYEYALDVRVVREVVRSPRISPVVEASGFVEGVINLRGKMAPVVDLGKRLHSSPTERTGESVVIVLKPGSRLVGFIVSSITELATIREQAIEPPAEMDGEDRSYWARGMACLDDRLIVILNPDGILRADEQCAHRFTDYDEARAESTGKAEPALRRIISFELDDELYGADIHEVAEIMEMTPIMPLPNTRASVLGLINLRGATVPVIDLRLEFGLNVKPCTPDTRIIIMKHSNLLVGVVVDRMWELLRIAAGDLQPVPPGVASIHPRFFRGVCSVTKHMLVLLDMGRILTETAHDGRKNRL